MFLYVGVDELEVGREIALAILALGDECLAVGVHLRHALGGEVLVHGVLEAAVQVEALVDFAHDKALRNPPPPHTHTHTTTNISPKKYAKRH